MGILLFFPKMDLDYDSDGYLTLNCLTVIPGDIVVTIIVTGKGDWLVGAKNPDGRFCVGSIYAVGTEIFSLCENPEYLEDKYGEGFNLPISNIKDLLIEKRWYNPIVGMMKRILAYWKK